MALSTVRKHQVAPRDVYVQVQGNIRCLCPACSEDIIISVKIGPQAYTCLRTNLPVSQEAVLEAMKTGDVVS